ncbi:hypothetical protein BDR04DRAFT_1122712 [Suillus decipiens]|nr:hypothetical protein BDR04DRAFT_1122712 [Suillus decipiens]
MSIQESNHALSVANELLCKALAWIKHFQADGWVSQALQQHSRNALVILPLLLSVAAEVWEMMNNGQAPQWEHTKGFIAPGVAQVLQHMNAIPPQLPKVIGD